MMLNIYLWKHNLLPSDQHTIHLYRDRVQDRFLSANAPDRDQADLMGHKFDRPSYGDGASIAQKLQWMEKIRFRAFPVAK